MELSTRSGSRTIKATLEFWNIGAALLSFSRPVSSSGMLLPMGQTCPETILCFLLEKCQMIRISLWPLCSNALYRIFGAQLKAWLSQHGLLGVETLSLPLMNECIM